MRIEWINPAGANFYGPNLYRHISGRKVVLQYCVKSKDKSIRTGPDEDPAYVEKMRTWLQHYPLKVMLLGVVVHPL